MSIDRKKLILEAATKCFSLFGYKATTNEMEMFIVSYIREKIKIAVDKGEIRSCNPEITDFLMLKTYFALIFDWERNHQPLEKEEIAEILHLYLFKGLSISP